MACYLTGAALVAGGIDVANVIAGSFRQEYCPAFLLGRVTAGMRFLAYGMVPSGALLAGALGTTLGVRNALWVLQALFAAADLILLTSPWRPRQPGGPLPVAPRPVTPGITTPPPASQTDTTSETGQQHNQ
jgi:hypothetical protein